MNNTNNPFEFELPSGWEDQTVYVFKGPEVNELEHSVMLIIDRKVRQYEISNFAMMRTSPIIETMDNIEVLKDEEITGPDGNPAWEFVYKWVPSDDQVFFIKYVFVLKHKMGFTFSGKFTKQTLKTVGAQLKQMVETFLPGTYQEPEED